MKNYNLVALAGLLFSGGTNTFGRPSGARAEDIPYTPVPKKFRSEPKPLSKKQKAKRAKRVHIDFETEGGPYIRKGNKIEKL